MRKTTKIKKRKFSRKNAINLLTDISNVSKSDPSSNFFVTLYTND